MSCYDVQATNVSYAGAVATVQSCTSGSEYVQCNLNSDTMYSFEVIGVGPSGLRSNDLKIGPFQLNWLRTVENQTTITSPGWNETSFVTGSLPTIQVTVENLNIGFEPILVGTLVNRCKLDNNSFNVLTRPLVPGDENYTAVGATPLGLNAAPVFTSTFQLVNSSTGLFEVKTTETQPITGAYSLIVYSLEAGGLWSQFWQNPALTGTPLYSRKDTTMELTLTGALSRQVSVRWTGFIESRRGELFTFIVDSTGLGSVWIDDVLVIGRGLKLGRALLKESIPLNRKFSRIRVEYIQGASVTGNSWFRLYWISASQPLEVIPVRSLFRSIPVQNTVKSMNILVGSMAVGKTTVSGLESGSIVAGVSGVLRITPRDSLGVQIFNDTNLHYTATFTSQYSLIPEPLKFASNIASNGTYFIPFSLITADQYTVDVTDDASGQALPDSPFVVSVLPSAGDLIAAVVVDLSTTVAGSTSVIMFSVLDKYGNDVGAIRTIPSGLFLSAAWQSDTLTAERLGDDDDVALRSESFGTVFTNASFSFSETTVTYVARIKIPRAGQFVFTLGIQDGATAYVDFMDVRAGIVSHSVEAVVVGYPDMTKPLPSAATSTFTVQLRDEYMNAIVEVPTQVEPVEIYLSSGDTGTCQPSEEVEGQYTCTISPTVSAPELGLAITVGGVPATLKGVRGPWVLGVNPGDPSALTCEVTGIYKSEFMVGTPVLVYLVVKDGFGNLVYANESASLDVNVRFLDSSDRTVMTLDNSTFTWDSGSESLLIPFDLTTRSLAPLFLAVYVGGDRVPYDSPPITVSEGTISAMGTDCAPVANFKAGTACAISCSLRDSAGNAVTASNAHVQLELAHATNLSVPTVQAVATYIEDYEIVSSIITLAGTYWAYVLVAEPGGVMVSYYSQASLIGDPLVDVRGGGNSAPAVLYSAIDSYISFNATGPLVRDGTAVTTVVWSGKLRGPLTGTVTFRLTSDGGAIVKFNGVRLVDSIDNNAPLNTTFTYAMTLDVYVNLHIEYVPMTTQAGLSFEWKYSGSIPSDFLIVPPSFLYALLNNGGTYQSVTVSAGAVSVLTTVVFPNSLVAEVPDFIVIQPVDQYGNSHTSSPSCLFSTGVAPGCLFQVSLVEYDGSVFGTAVDMGDGRIKVPVTFATDGPKRVSVKLQTANGVYTDINGSPFIVTVEA